jgi:transcriptional regulator with XRE-family HTH domain
MQQLKRLREERGLSQVKLAARADLNPATVNQIERGVRDASPGTLRKLASALGVGLAELIQDDYPKGQAPQPSLEDAAQSDEVQESLAILFRGLTRRGQGIVEQSRREGPSEVLSKALAEHHAEVAALYRIKGGRDIYGRDSEALSSSEAAYQEVADKILAMLRQDIEASDEERRIARRFKQSNRSEDIEERKADAS